MPQKGICIITVRQATQQQICQLHPCQVKCTYLQHDDFRGSRLHCLHIISTSISQRRWVCWVFSTVLQRKQKLLLQLQYLAKFPVCCPCFQLPVWLMTNADGFVDPHHLSLDISGCVGLKRAFAISGPQHYARA